MEFIYNVQLGKLEVSQPDAGSVPEVKVERRQKPTVDSKLEQPNLQRPKFEPRPEPKLEMKKTPIDESKLPREGAVMIRVGEFISYKEGNLTLNIPVKNEEESKATVFPGVTAVAIDPRDPLGMKKLPAEEVFSGMKVGTTVYVMTNKRGELTFSVAYERASNPKLEMKTPPIDESKLPRVGVEPKPKPVTPEGAVTTRVG